MKLESEIVLAMRSELERQMRETKYDPPRVLIFQNLHIVNIDGTIDLLSLANAVLKVHPQAPVDWPMSHSGG